MDNSPFAQAVLAIDRGQVEELRELLTAHPDLVEAVGDARDGDYFAESTLLQHVAWNPYPSHREHGLETDDPARMPRNMPEIVRALATAGADVTAKNGGGNDVVALLLTGRLASEAQLTAPLLEALEEAGAALDLSAGTVHQALANHSSDGARALLARGAAWDARIAAGLGELDRLRTLVDQGQPSPEELGLAAIHAYIGGHRKTLFWLLTLELDVDVTGIQEGTLLHRACANGDVELIARLSEIGADPNHRGNSFRATPLDWADHAGQTEAVRWIVEHVGGQLDLFQTAAHGLTELARLIVLEHPDDVHETRDIWSYPAVQPLRIAVMQGHLDVARLLVERGARVDHRGGDGITAADEARSRQNDAWTALFAGSGSP